MAIHADSEIFEDIEIPVGPLSMWNKQIEKLTKVFRETDIKPAYLALISSVNDEVFQNRLFKDSKLFI